jgi:hypothetical protein
MKERTVAKRIANNTTSLVVKQRKVYTAHYLCSGSQILGKTWNIEYNEHLKMGM